MNEQAIREELTFRAGKRGQDVASPEFKERLDVGVRWEWEQKQNYDKVIPNTRDAEDRAVSELIAWHGHNEKRLTIVSGASCSGKGTIIDRANLADVIKVKLATTRKRRKGEPNDAYEFVTIDELQEMQDKCTHIVTPVYPDQGLSIGLEIKQLTKAMTDRSTRRYLLETTPEMAMIIKRLYPSAVGTAFISCVAPASTVLNRWSSETYCYRGLPGIGMAYSSNSAVLHAAGEWCRCGHLALPHDQIARSACGQESLRAKGHLIGAGDVYSIVYGGVGLIHTSAAGAFYQKVDHDPDWISKHLIWAYDPMGEVHEARDVLSRLFSDKARARKYVGLISECAVQVAAALKKPDAGDLASLLKKYRDDFDRWLRGGLIHDSVSEMADALEAALHPHLLAWKPMGAGSSSSMCAVVTDAEAMQKAQEAFRKACWTSHPVRVAEGLKREDEAEKVTVSAPYRLDLVAAADLSIDPAIGCDGVCCAIAIEPRSTVTLTRA
jgi:guanylate kinase